MYLIPKKYKCPKCNCEIEYAPNFNYPLANPDNAWEIICHKCIWDFLAKNVPLMVEEKE